MYADRTHPALIFQIRSAFVHCLKLRHLNSCFAHRGPHDLRDTNYANRVLFLAGVLADWFITRRYLESQRLSAHSSELRLFLLALVYRAALYGAYTTPMGQYAA